MIGVNFKDGSGSAKRLIVPIRASMQIAVWKAGFMEEDFEGIRF